MAKIQIKSERLTPFGGLFSIMEQFDSTLSSVINSTLGLRCRSFGYQYSEIILSLAFLLNQSDEGLADFPAVGQRLLHLVTCAELVKQAVYQPAAVLQQVGIRWIAYLSVAACGVNLHRTAVIVAGTIVTVPQTFVVFPLYPVPGKVVGQLDPTVGFA